MRIEATIAPADDWQAVLPLITSPQGDGWGLATRFPQGLRAALPPERQHLVVVRHHGRIIACGLRSVRPVWHGAHPAWLGYLAQMRRDPAVSPFLARAALEAAFACLAATRQADELPVDLTSILSSNHRARRLLEAGLPGVPAYHPRAQYTTRVWSARSLRRMAGLLTGMGDLAPRHPGLMLQPRAVVGGPLTTVDDQAWGRLDDPAGRREVLITALPPALRWLGPLINVLRRAQGLPVLPRPGRPISQVFLGSWGWRPGAACAAFAVAGALAGRISPDRLVVAGWCEDHPEAAALARLAPPAERISAQWYTVGGTLPPGPWHLDAGDL